MDLSWSLESHKVNTTRIDGSFAIASAFGRATKEKEKVSLAGQRVPESRDIETKQSLRDQNVLSQPTILPELKSAALEHAISTIPGCQ